MISFKKLLGKEEKFYDLLEASADEARSSAELLAKILKDDNATDASSIHDIIHTRRKDKRITQQITEELCKTFVTPFEREDIEALSLALYRIPKTVEKIVERLSICPARIPRESMQRQIVLLVEAVDAVDFMVKQLRKGTQVDRARDAGQVVFQIMLKNSCARQPCFAAESHDHFPISEVCFLDRIRNSS